MKLLALEQQSYEQQQIKFAHHYYACDFECTTIEPYTVYMVTIECVDTHEQWLFSTIDEFLAFCEEHPNSTMYFHNGGSYDFEFILNRCFNRPDWRVSTGRKLTLVKQFNYPMLTKHNKPMIRDNQFVIAKTSIKLLDSLDVVQGSIKSLGESIGMLKGNGTIETPLVASIDTNSWVEQTDYTGLTFKTHYSNFDVDCIKRGWWKYAMQDTAILAEVLRQYDVITNADKQKYTSASIAYDNMIHSNPNYVQQLEVEKKSSKAFKQQQISLNRIAKQAYKGGISWANPTYARTNEIVSTKHGYHLDYTSMYPSIYMQPQLYPLPFKRPIDKQTNLFIAHFKNLRCVCLYNKFPLLKTRTDVKGDNSKYYINVFNGDVSLTSVEYYYMLECYTNIKYDSVSIMYYEEHIELEQALVNHGNYWYDIKETSTGAKRVISKMMLNTAYGYLGFFEKDVKLYHYKLKDSVVYKELYDESATGIWNAEVPAASFITAYGRVKLARDINKIGINNVICCDTDSLFTIDKTLDQLQSLVDIDDIRLGALKIEHTFTKIKAIKSKTWCISNDDYIPIAQATAGSNYKFKNINSFSSGQQFYSSVKVLGVGGVGIKQQMKILGELDY